MHVECTPVGVPVVSRQAGVMGVTVGMRSTYVSCRRRGHAGVACPSPPWSMVHALYVACKDQWSDSARDVKVACSALALVKYQHATPREWNMQVGRLEQNSAPPRAAAVSRATGTAQAQQPC